MVFDRALSDDEKKELTWSLSHKWKKSKLHLSSPSDPENVVVTPFFEGFKIKVEDDQHENYKYMLSYDEGNTAPRDCLEGKEIRGQNDFIKNLKPSTQYSLRICGANDKIPAEYSKGLTYTGLTLREHPLPLSNHLSFWFEADAGVKKNDNQLVSRWNNLAYTENYVIQNQDQYKPRFIAEGINSLPSIEFDGKDDFLEGIIDPKKIQTVFITFKVDSSLQDSGELGQLFGSYGEKAHVAADPRFANAPGFSFDGNSGNSAAKGKISLDDGPFSSQFFSNSNEVSWFYDTHHLAVAVFNEKREISKYHVGNLSYKHGIGLHHFGGQISNIIVYDKKLNQGQISAVKNYIRDSTLVREFANFLESCELGSHNCD